FQADSLGQFERLGQCHIAIPRAMTDEGVPQQVTRATEAGSVENWSPWLSGSRLTVCVFWFGIPRTAQPICPLVTTRSKTGQGGARAVIGSSVQIVVAAHIGTVTLVEGGSLAGVREVY